MKLKKDEIEMLKKKWKYKLRNSKTLTYKLVALRHEKIIKQFLKRSVLKRGMLLVIG